MFGLKDSYASALGNQRGPRLIEIPNPFTTVTGFDSLHELFDSFGIISVQKVPDPILVGLINGTKDMYFIAEWGDDVKLQDLV